MKQVFVRQILCFFVAILLSILPLPQWIGFYRPVWILLVMLFWVFYYPNSLNIFLIFCLGLLMDSLHITLLGEHGFILLSCYAMACLFQRRFRYFSLLQQMLVVGGISAFYQLLLTVFAIAEGNAHHWGVFWWGALLSMLFWPWVNVLLKDLIHYPSNRH